MKYYIDENGNYLGGFDGAPPIGARPVSFPPDNAMDKWDGQKWVDGSGKYAILRQNEYPPIGDQLDALLKGFNQMRLEGRNIPEDLDRIVNSWLAVKAKYPKEVQP